jgi:recombinational DNA repair protein RecR
MKNIKEGYLNMVKKTVNKLDANIADLGNKRMGICKRCPELTNRNTCDLCGCYMPAKTLATESKCPDGKW